MQEAGREMGSGRERHEGGQVDMGQTGRDSIRKGDRKRDRKLVS